MVKEVGLFHIGAIKPFEKYSPICYQNNNWRLKPHTGE
jgi:hypothetical protein